MGTQCGNVGLLHEEALICRTQQKGGFVCAEGMPQGLWSRGNLSHSAVDKTEQQSSEQGAVNDIPDRDCPQLARLVPWFGSPDTRVALSSIVLEAKVRASKASLSIFLSFLAFVTSG